MSKAAQVSVQHNFGQFIHFQHLNMHIYRFCPPIIQNKKGVPEHYVLMYKVFSFQLTFRCIQAQSQTQFIGSERQKSRIFAFAHFHFPGAYSSATLPSSGQNLLCAALKPKIHNRLCSLHVTGLQHVVMVLNNAVNLVLYRGSFLISCIYKVLQNLHKR